jgi:hypothetical protein
MQIKENKTKGKERLFNEDTADIIREKQEKQEWTVEENRKRPVKEEKKTKEKNSKHEGKRKRERASF